MNQHPNIEALIRQKLYDTEVTPPAFVWPNVEAALRKRKRRAFLWIFSGVGIAMLCTGLLVRSHWKNSGIGKTSDTIAQTAHFPLINTADSMLQTSAAPTNLDASAPTDLSDQSTVQLEGSTHLSPSIGITSTTTNTKKNIYAKKGTISLAGSSREEIPALKGRTSTNAPDVVMPIAYNAFSVESITATFEPANAPEPLLTKDKLSFLPLLFIPLNQPFATADPSGLTRKYVRKKKEPKTCYNFAKHPNAWFVDVYAGPSFAWKELSTNNPEYKGYLQNRRNTERRDWAFNGGVRGTLLFDGHFMLRLGLHYEQMTEIFEFIDPNSITIKYQDRITFVNGQQVIIRDTTGIEYGSNYSKAYNRFGMVEIPVQAGVELRKGRSGFSFNAGLSFNMFFWKRGAILDINSNTKYFTPGKQNATEIFQKRTSISAIGSVQWFYHLKPTLRVYVEPYFRQVVQPVNLPSHPIGTRYGVGGISLGMTKIL